MPIFDQGYQHWSGRLSGHAWRWLAIARHGLRTGMKNRALRYLLFVSWSPALSLAAVLCAWGLLERKSDVIMSYMRYLSFLGPQMLADPRSFRLEVWTLCYSFFLRIELYFSMILILMVGPNLISQDLRFNALPLYFSRPLRRIDYFFGKLGVIGGLLLMVVVLPSVVAYLLGLLFSLDITIIRDTFPLLLSSIAYGIVITLSAGLLILALSSLSRNSRYVALLWLGIWFISSITAGILEGVQEQERWQTAHSTMPAPSPPRGRMTRDDSMRYQRDYMAERQRMMEQIAMAKAQAASRDWRPLVSYTANLQRIGQHLLRSDDRWRKISELTPPGQRDQFLLNYMGYQYPWYWSAAVLTGLLGLSACILHFRVKSLDRLK
jgi:ABC-2 type transport system permease protein